MQTNDRNAKKSNPTIDIRTYTVNMLSRKIEKQMNILLS